MDLGDSQALGCVQGVQKAQSAQWGDVTEFIDLARLDTKLPAWDIVGLSQGYQQGLQLGMAFHTVFPNLFTNKWLDLLVANLEGSMNPFLNSLTGNVSGLIVDWEWS